MHSIVKINTDLINKKQPNQDTLNAIHELESGNGSHYDSMDDVWREIEAN